MTYTLSPGWTIALTVAVVWELCWKGLALWRASRNNQIGWYVALLIINSVGILPIIYVLLHPSGGKGGLEYEETSSVD
jgi:hypothetical protein